MEILILLIILVIIFSPLIIGSMIMGWQKKIKENTMNLAYLKTVLLDIHGLISSLVFLCLFLEVKY